MPFKAQYSESLIARRHGLRGRVLVCTDWPGYLDGSAQADTCVSIVECLEPSASSPSPLFAQVDQAELTRPQQMGYRISAGG
jgi:hypothetical protein